MPSASLSPAAPPAAAMPASPNNASGGGSMRPPLMRKQSSQSSHSSRQQHTNLTSPGSATEHHPLRHPVRTARHAKVVLPRNHSSARNLAKLNGRQQQQVQYADDGRRHSRQRSHEGDTEIRLPGSLDESVSMKPPMRRNMTAYQLPRNTSHAKLKKNLSHGQLTRLGSGKNLAALNQQRAPPSPVLKGKSKRPKSAEIIEIEGDLAVQEEEQQRSRRPPHQRKGSTKKVGFAVGSAGDSSGGEEALQMEGSGLQEDEWTEDSASASPYSTRQNTANNSRRTSVVVDKVNDKLASKTAARIQEYKAIELQADESKKPPQSDEENQDEDEDSDEPSPITMGQDSKTTVPNETQKEHDQIAQPHTKEPQAFPEKPAHHTVLPKQQPPQRSPLHMAKEYSNPTTQRLLDKNHQLPAPALVSNVSALDDTHSSRGSPAPSLRSSRSNMADGASEQQEDELVSRFMPTGSHPSTGSGPTTAVSTPKQTEFHTPEEDSTLAQQRREKNISGFSIGPVSPGSTVSGSFGVTTPAIGRSRTELRMLQEKAMADIESQADQRPTLPKHVYDRRNESLKYYLSTGGGYGEGRTGTAAPLAMGPDVFQGRFRALNTELRVVQKFRDPIGEAVNRLKGCKGSKLSQRTQKTQPATLPMSKSAVSLPVARRVAADLSKSASPPKAGSLKNAAQSSVNMQGGGSGSERQKQRREVSFARTPPETREFVPAEEELGADGIARRMWEGI